MTTRSCPFGMLLRLSPMTAVLCAGLLAGCASRPGPEVLVPVAAASDAKLVPVFVATTRTRQAPDQNVFTSDRSATLNFARYTISVPPGHVPAKIEWPSGAPDPRVSFASVDQAGLTATTFLTEVGASRVSGAAPRSMGSRTTRRNAIVYVHGYNENFQEALFRLAGMAADADMAATPILFSWPSLGALSGYVADKDSVTYSRDYLVQTLTMLAADPRIGKITVLGHSMGGWLTAEALRQLRLTRQDRVLARLEVVLAAPDIDVDVFRAQMTVIGRMQEPMTVLVSKDDRALAVSSLITTERPRVGALDVENPLVQEAAQKANIRIVDISNLPSADRFNHSRFTALAALYPKVSHDQNRNIGNAGAFVLDAVGTTVAAPFRIGSKVLGNN